MYMQALGIYMVYTWYIPCIIFIGVPDGHRTCDVVRSVHIVRTRTTSYVRRTTSCIHIVYDIVRQTKHATSYVYYVRHRRSISYAMSYVQFSTYDIVRQHTISYIK